MNDYVSEMGACIFISRKKRDCFFCVLYCWITWLTSWSSAAAAAAGAAAMTESGKPRPAKRSHAAGRKVDRFQRDKRDPSVIVFSEISVATVRIPLKFSKKQKLLPRRHETQKPEA